MCPPGSIVANARVRIAGEPRVRTTSATARHNCQRTYDLRAAARRRRSNLTLRRYPRCRLRRRSPSVSIFSFKGASAAPLTRPIASFPSAARTGNFGCQRLPHHEGCLVRTSSASNRGSERRSSNQGCTSSCSNLMLRSSTPFPSQKKASSLSPRPI